MAEQFDDSKVAYVISRYTNENSNYKRHIIDANWKPLCMSHTRSFTLEYTTGQSDCKRCVRMLTRELRGKGEQNANCNSRKNS